MAVAVFDWAAWSVLYPELVAQGVTEPWTTATFNGPASLLLDNTDASPVQDAGQRATLLGIIVAHLAAMNPSFGGGGGVGRVASASEGSVSVSFDYGQVKAQAAWWVQTPYGATYWQMTARYRAFTYVAAPQPFQEPLYGWPGRQPGQW